MQQQHRRSGAADDARDAHTSNVQRLAVESLEHAPLYTGAASRGILGGRRLHPRRFDGERKIRPHLEGVSRRVR